MLFDGKQHTSSIVIAIEFLSKSSAGSRPAPSYLTIFATVCSLSDPSIVLPSGEAELTRVSFQLVTLVLRDVKSQLTRTFPKNFTNVELHEQGGPQYTHGRYGKRPCGRDAEGGRKCEVVVNSVTSDGAQDGKVNLRSF